MKASEKRTDIQIREYPAADESIAKELISFSEAWEREGSCRGYVKNGRESLEGNRIFLAKSEEQTVGYLFGHIVTAEKTTSIMEKGTEYFEIEEIYVAPHMRSRGIGGKLFRYAEETVKREGTEVICLSTATKNWRAILHFYIEEMEMEFWSARLFKRI